jgi:ABC-type bacteriocin/lantibiotic exporter with double-glycine peptidase domain
MATSSSQQGLRSVGPFLLYVLRRFPLTWVALSLTFALLFLEYLGMSLMIPLAASASGAGGGRVTLFWMKAATHVGLTPGLLTWVWLFLVLLGLRTITGYIHVLVTAFVAKQVHRQLSSDVFSRVLLHEPMNQVYRRTIGHYVSLAGDDTFRAGTLINSAFIILASFFSASAGLVLLLLFSAQVFGVTLAFLAVSAVLVLTCIRTMLRINTQSVALSREAGTNFLEGLNGLRSIRSLSSEHYLLDTYRTQMQRYTRLLFNIDAIRAGTRAMPGVLALLTGVVLFGPWFADRITLTPETVFAGTTILLRVFAALGALMGAAGVFLVDARAAKDLGELISAHEEAIDEPHPAPTAHQQPAPFSSIELSNVTYSYTAGKSVLHELNQRFVPGRTYAIVGPSGSGKSTLADLLLGLLQPDSGQIRLADQVGGEGCARVLKRNVVLVEQQPRIFSVSVRENLLFGLSVDEQALWDALDVVDMRTTVQAMPAGIDTVLEYQGANLSGGQRQRIAIARALLRKPRVLILDEATSALDPDTRDTVVDRIKQRFSSSILIFITHDHKIATLVDEVLEIEAPARAPSTTCA